MVLDHPEIPLHNNPTELGARRRVRLRDVSFGARTQHGAALWNIGHTLTATAQQFGVNSHQYVRNRLCGHVDLVPLAAIMTARAGVLNLGASWQNRRQRPDWMPVSVSMWHASYPGLLRRYVFCPTNTHGPYIPVHRLTPVYNT